MGLPERMEILGLPDRPDLQEIEAYQVHQGPLVSLDLLGNQARQVRTAILDSRVHKDNRVRRVYKDLLDPTVNQVLRVRTATQELRVLRVSQEIKDFKARLVIQGPRVALVQQVTGETQE